MSKDDSEVLTYMIDTVRHVITRQSGHEDRWSTWYTDRQDLRREYAIPYSFLSVPVDEETLAAAARSRAKRSDSSLFSRFFSSFDTPQKLIFFILDDELEEELEKVGFTNASE